MFKRNENLRGAGERIAMTPEQLQEYLKCKQSIFHFANYFTIIAADGEHPIKLREYQERLVKSIITKVPEKNNRIIMMGALDNLVKGAAGQAVQNMNLLFGFDEDEGLRQVPMFP